MRLVQVGATVYALARLVFEFSASLIHTVPQLLPAVLLLTRTQNRETLKVTPLDQGWQIRWVANKYVQNTLKIR